MKIEEIKSLHQRHKEDSLYHRYITNKHIESLLEKMSGSLLVETIGESVLKDSIYGVKIGNGNKRILMWSQMHGNESTTTKALFDLLNSFLDSNSDLDSILEACTLYIIPILNPDGALAYTRVNANKVDLNRDAQKLSQPESKVLNAAFESFNPHFCYNLHGQRTIFSAGNVKKIATVSFLAPAQDQSCTVTPNRKIAMEVIGEMNNKLQEIIPEQVGVYDDAFNLNCVGDTFQSKNVPTILFEAGHYENDYAREFTREYIYISLLTSLDYLSKNKVKGDYHESYFNIPENAKCFFDVIIRNAKIVKDSESFIADIGILFVERLIDGKIQFIPKIDKIENLNSFYGHKELDAKESIVLDNNSESIKVGDENVFVIIDNEKTALYSQ